MSRTRFFLHSGALLALLVGFGCTSRSPEAAAPEETPPPANPQARGIFDPGALPGSAPPPSLSSAPIAVLDYGPLERTEGGTSVHVRFNQPIAALELDDDSLEGVLVIDPPVRGRTFWRSPELLTFEPDEPWQPARRYTVRLAKPLRTADGERQFSEALEWTFETPRPGVLEGASLTEVVARRRRRIDTYVVFNSPVSLAQARAHIRAKAHLRGESELDRNDGFETPDDITGGSKAVPIKVQRLTSRLRKKYGLEDTIWNLQEDRTFLVSPRGLWPSASVITIEVRPGLRSEVGELALETPWSHSFAMYGPQRLIEHSCGRDETCPLGPLSLLFRNPIPERELKKIRVKPKPKDLEIELLDTWGQGGEEIQISGIFLPGKTYQIELPADLRDIYGQRLGVARKLKVTIDREPVVALSLADATLLAGRPRTFGLSARHVDRVEVRVATLDDDEAAWQVSQSPHRRSWPSGQTEVSKQIQLRPKGPTDWSEIAVDLRDYVGDRRGAFVVEVRAIQAVKAAADQQLPVPVRGLVRVTNIGAVVLASRPQTLVRVVNLETGAPVAGAKARYFQIDGKAPIALGSTDAEGLIKVLPETICPESKPKSKTKTKTKGKAKRTSKRSKPRCDAAPSGRGVLIIDAPGGDRAYVDLAAPVGSEESKGLRPGERLIGRVISERGVYRPGEKVHVVGWSAVDTPFARSNLRRVKRTRVTFELTDPRGEVVSEIKTRTSAEGKFSASFVLPEGAALGSYTVSASLLGASISRRLKVEDFRTPEFEVSARSLRPDVIADSGQTVHISANYYFGGKVTLDRVSFTDQCETFHYRPPGLDPRWRVGAYEDRYIGRSTGVRTVASRLASPRKGERDINLKTRARSEGLADRCTVSVEVRDASLQGIGAEDTYTVHPASFYLAIETPDRSLVAGDSYALPLRAVHFDGHRVDARKVEVEVKRFYQKARTRDEDGRRVLYGYDDKSEVIKRCTVNLQSRGADATCGLKRLKKGRYTIVARATEGSHRTRSEATIWVRERSPGLQRWSWPTPSRLEIHASTDDVQPGDKVSVIVQSPWDLIGGVVAVERAGIREYHPIQFNKDKRARIDLVADDTWTPFVRLDAVAIRPPQGKNSLPRIERAQARIEQGYEHRRLAVSVAAPVEAGPSETVEVTVSVLDAQGKPSAARVALWAVDEAVLSLTSYEVPDLLSAFVPRRRSTETRLYDDFSSLILPFVASGGDPWLTSFGAGGMGGVGSGYGGGGAVGFGGRGRAAPPARSRFETTPVFFADLAVGPSGVRTEKIQLPDNLTTFRVLAVASARLVDGQSPGRFGVGDARLRVTRPLVVRPALPRIMRPGDRAEVAAILQNRSERPGTIEVRASLSAGKSKLAALTLASAKTVSVKVDANGQVRVPFTIEANRPGEPEIELQATFTDDRGNRHQDGVKLPLRVAPERTLIERVATYGSVDDAQAIAVPIRLPKDVSPDVGGIQISTTSTLLGGVQDAVQGLIYYPYGCIEQTSSRLLPLVAIADLGALIPLGVDVDSMVRDGIERILSMQLPEGGFSYWPGGTEAAPYSSAYATWVLLRAEKAGFEVPRGGLNRALDYLESVVNYNSISTVQSYGHV